MRSRCSAPPSFQALAPPARSGGARRALLLAALIALGLAAACGGSGGGGKTDPPPAPPPQDPNVLPPPQQPIVLTYAAATDAERQELVARAEAHLTFRHLRRTLERSGLVAQPAEALVARRGDAVETRALMLPLRTADGSKEAFLAYGVDEQQPPNEHVFSLTFDRVGRIALGHRRAADGAVQVEVYPIAPPANQSLLRTSAATTESETCRICTASCEQTQQSRVLSCLGRSAISAVNVANAGKKAWKATLAAASAETKRAVADAVGDAVGEVDGINSGVESMKSCLFDQPLECSPGGAMCRDLCTPCRGSLECGGVDACVAGECRRACGSSLCGASETCSAATLTCVPNEQGCIAGNYVGTYRFGGGIAPACCAFAPNVNCGATLSGTWGGCCPPGTLCLPLQNGYGCCTPGLNCE